MKSISRENTVQFRWLGILVIFAALFLFFTSGSDYGEGGDEEEEEEEGEIESVLEISEESQTLAAIKLEKAESKLVRTTIVLNGRIFPDQNRLAQIVARYPGLVRAVYKDLGDKIKAQESLASVEANGSQAVFPIKSKIAGTVIRKSIVSGEFVSDKDILFEVSDLSNVWVNLNVTEQDFGKVREGQTVYVRMWDQDDEIETKVTYVSPMVHPDSQTLLARAVIENNGGYWRPGSFVTARVVVDQKSVEVAIREEAVQFIDEKPVAFVKNGEDTFELRKIRLGVRGEGFVQVSKGIEHNEHYVSKNSFVLKSELLKSLAGDDD